VAALPSEVLCIGLTSSRIELRASIHAIVMVPELVQQHIEELKRPGLSAGPLDSNLAATLLVAAAEGIEKLGILVDEVGIGELPQGPRPRTNVNNTGHMPPVVVPRSSREDDGIKALRKLVPFGDESDEVGDVALLEEVNEAPSRAPAIHNQLRLRSVVVVGCLVNPAVSVQASLQMRTTSMSDRSGAHFISVKGPRAAFKDQLDET
jgi:hypothetical protein